MEPTLSEETVGAPTQNGMTLDSHASFNFTRRFSLFFCGKGSSGLAYREL